jgi:hypothetical protein
MIDASRALLILGSSPWGVPMVTLGVLPEKNLAVEPA